MEFQKGMQNTEDINFKTPDFYELYDTANDPWMMKNVHNSTDSATTNAMHDQLHVFASCAGDACP
jgi:hypothetical protein